jgi:hypothetical protein
MNFFLVLGFCIAAWLSGALFGGWFVTLRASQSGRRQRRSRYFEEETDVWRPIRRLGRVGVSLSLLLVACLLMIAMGLLLTAPHKTPGTLRGRVSANVSAPAGFTASANLASFLTRLPSSSLRSMALMVA